MHDSYGPRVAALLLERDTLQAEQIDAAIFPDGNPLNRPATAWWARRRDETG